MPIGYVCLSRSDPRLLTDTDGLPRILIVNDREVLLQLGVFGRTVVVVGRTIPRERDRDFSFVSVNLWIKLA